MLSKKLSKWILIGGVGALINSIIFTFLFKSAYDSFFGPIFYFVHSLITILAGYFLLKRNNIGVLLLTISFLMFILALFIPAPFLNLHDHKSPIEDTSLFGYTILVSAVVTLLIYPFFVPIFTLIFLISVGRGTIILLTHHLFKSKAIK